MKAEQPAFPPTALYPSEYDSGPKPIDIQLNMEKVSIVASSTDSDLEAFSHNPADASFAALSFQTTANTNYPNQGFLSY